MRLIKADLSSFDQTDYHKDVKWLADLFFLVRPSGHMLMATDKKDTWTDSQLLIMPDWRVNRCFPCENYDDNTLRDPQNFIAAFFSEHCWFL